MSPEKIFGALASYLEIEYQQKTNQCKMIKDEITKTTEIMSLFELRTLEQDKEVVRKYVLKPLEAIEDSLVYANEWNEKTKQKIKTKAEKCTDQEYVVSVEDVLNRYIAEFEDVLENDFDIIETEKTRVFDYLGESREKEI